VSHLFLACESCGNDERVELPMSIALFLRLSKTRCTRCDRDWSHLRAAPKETKP
jgi:hypothetical protein